MDWIFIKKDSLLRRYWIDQNKIIDEQVEIEGELFHHIFDVCRQGLGSRFELISDDSFAYFSEVIKLGKKNAIVKVLEKRQLPVLKKPYIKLFLSIPKFSTFELILEKSVELGVSSIYPFVSEFSFVRKVDDRLENKADRWNRIITSATQQTGRGDLMSLHSPCKLLEALNNFNQKENVLGLFPYEGDSQKHLRQRLEEVSSQKWEEIWLFIGSEGGFSQDEVELFKKYNIEPITLGAQILRVETACLAVISILKYQWQLL